MTTNSTGARLSIEIDTTDLNRAETAAKAASQRFIDVARAADATTQALNKTAKAASGLELSFEEYVQAASEGVRETERLERDVMRLAKAISGTNASIDQMAANVAKLSAKTGSAAEYVEHYKKALTALRGAQADYNKIADESANKTSLLIGAIGGLAGAFGYGLMQSVTSALAVISRLPIDMAYAADRVTTLNAKLAFSFRGNVDSARVAQRDLARIAMESGANYQELARNYGEIAVASRGTGLTRRDVTQITDAFNYMGGMAGTSPSDISRGMWQFQQALSIGRLNYQDARLMFQAIPAMDTVMALGAGPGQGITPGRLQSMISSGQVDAEKMVAFLIEGIRKLKEEGQTIAPTLERAQNRIGTQWELMLQTMGDKLNASPILQEWSNLIARMLERARLGVNPDSDPQRALAIANQDSDFLYGLKQAPGFFVGGGFRSRAAMRARAQATIDANAKAEAAADGRDRITAETDKNATVVEAARQSQSLEIQRQQLQQDILKANIALKSSLMNASDKAFVQSYVDGLQAQLLMIESTFARMARTASEAASDAGLGTIGAGLMSRARDVARASINEREGGGRDAAFAVLLNQELAQRGRGVTAGALDTALRRKYLVPGAAGADAIAGQAAYERAQLASQFGTLVDDPRYKGAIGRYLDAFGGQRADALRLGNDQAADERIAGNVYDLNAARARRDFAGDPAGMRARLRQIEIERQTRGVADPTKRAELAGQLGSLNTLSDEADAEGYRTASENRVRLAEKLTAVEARNSREYQIQRRIVEETERARTEGLKVSEAEIANRVRAEADASRELEKRDRAMRRLQSIGERTASAIGDAFDTALQDAFEKGRISLENLGKIVQALALDITQQIIRKSVADPISDAASSGIQNIFASLFKRSALGNTFVDGHVQPFGSGGVVSRPTLFGYGGGIGLAGEAGSEAILPLRRGTDGRLGVAGGGGGGDVQVVVNDMRGQQAEPVEVQSRRGPDGKRMIEVMVRDTVRSGFSQGHYDGAMRGRYGQGRVIKQV